LPLCPIPGWPPAPPVSVSVSVSVSSSQSMASEPIERRDRDVWVGSKGILPLCPIPGWPRSPPVSVSVSVSVSQSMASDRVEPRMKQGPLKSPQGMALRSHGRKPVV
jgi:hypothetical protein